MSGGARYSEVIARHIAVCHSVIMEDDQAGPLDRLKLLPVLHDVIIIKVSHLLYISQPNLL